MRDNDPMNDELPEHPIADDRPALGALVDADPADAPDIAEGLAAGLQRELDQTGTSVSEAGEQDS